MKEETFNVKKTEKITDSEGKESYILIYLKESSAQKLLTSDHIVLKEYVSSMGKQNA